MAIDVAGVSPAMRFFMAIVSTQGSCVGKASTVMDWSFKRLSHVVNINVFITGVRTGRRHLTVGVGRGVVIVGQGILRGILCIGQRVL